ncbi:hypothetical protein [Lactiplantibacillus herbarum]|uniref:hypothetical protein n=1 Tax=Lactiplantibacillus herbarum TaxID=1670446 RepID=UPI00064E92B6|nr:hypothetical protein [Lactiplantibacillus herbarum]
MKRQTQTVVVGGTQSASGKSLLTLALANVLTTWQATVTIVCCDYQTAAWTTIDKERRYHWQSDLQTPDERIDFSLALQSVQTDYLLVDLGSAGPTHDNYTWLLNECWLPLADRFILTYSAATDINKVLCQDLDALQFSMEYTVTKPKIYTVLNRYSVPAMMKPAFAPSELIPFHQQFRQRHVEFEALDIQPLGMINDARTNPESVLVDAENLLEKLAA